MTSEDRKKKEVAIESVEKHQTEAGVAMQPKP
jgi:hypothetical protein